MPTRIISVTVTVNVETNKGSHSAIFAISSDETPEEFIQKVTEKLESILDDE